MCSQIKNTLIFPQHLEQKVTTINTLKMLSTLKLLLYLVNSHYIPIKSEDPFILKTTKSYL
jgi:hypothetical protein